MTWITDNHANKMYIALRVTLGALNCQIPNTFNTFINQLFNLHYLTLTDEKSTHYY